MAGLQMALPLQLPLWLNPGNKKLFSHMIPFKLPNETHSAFSAIHLFKKIHVKWNNLNDFYKIWDILSNDHTDEKVIEEFWFEKLE